MITVPDCIYCRHSRMPHSATCDAFPKGIPDAILIQGRNHRKPYRGDHGIQFEPKPEFEAIYGESPLKEPVTAS